MKNYRGIISIVTLLCVNSMFASQYRPLPSIPVVSLTMDSILKGALDNPGNNDFAWKANQIYRYNYSKAMSKGGANLNLALAKDIADISANPSADQAAKMVGLRGAINNLYNMLEQYKALDAQQTSSSVPMSAPVVMLTLQSILSGALGEPYTSKANEIYNSGIAMYVNDLDKRISTLNQGRDAANAIKSSIDTVYNFLVNYRKNNQSVVQAPVYVPAPPVYSASSVLTLQSILNGALGEPYTSKVNEIYNSGITMYIDDLNKRINTFNMGNNAANNIKTMIDTVYGFLQNYRRSNPY